MVTSRYFKIKFEDGKSEIMRFNRETNTTRANRILRKRLHGFGIKQIRAIKYKE